jgi:hypothetical protein
VTVGAYWQHDRATLYGGDALAVLASLPSASVDAVITFAGLPNMPADELGKFQANHPPLVVVDIFGVLKGDTLPSLVARKTVTLAFSPRSATEVQEFGNESRVFERYYKILRAEGK